MMLLNIKSIVQLSKKMLTGRFTIDKVANLSISLAESINPSPFEEITLRNTGYLFIRNRTMHGFTVVNITEHIGFSTILANCSARCPPLELFIGKMVRFYHSQFQYLHQTYYVINAKNISPYIFQVQIDGHIRYLGIIKTLSFRFETEKLWVIKSLQSLDNARHRGTSSTPSTASNRLTTSATGASSSSKLILLI